MQSENIGKEYLTSILNNRDRDKAKKLLNDPKELYSLKETIVNLKILEAKVTAYLSQQEELDPELLKQLLSIETTLVKSVSSAIETETKLGKLVSIEELSSYTEIFVQYLIKYIEDEAERRRLLAELEYKVSNMGQEDSETVDSEFRLLES